MSVPASDPYTVLGLAPGASDGELRRAYRALVKRHHPDHNGGSTESAARFAQIQDAYARVVEARAASVPSAAAGRPGDPDSPIERRIADLERELAATRAAQRAAAAARPPTAPGPADDRPDRPTPHQLGYYETDDSLTSIIDDAAAGLADRLKEARHGELARRLTDLLGGRHDES